ncbi:MAG: sigma-E factor negative regulatory protein [Hydrogenophaga sp.]|uniref:sigma-E factor negative regulatory protein n=2 Tax=Hydrogenophaga sp. TaxID=1904254 RepID=UPI003D0D62F1
MNASEMKSNPLTSPDALSALVDGELDASGLRSLLEEVEVQPQSLGSWHAYQVIGEVLRGSSGVVCAQAPGDFLAGVRERLKSEVALDVAPPVVARVAPAPASAANDPVFRWKILAGFASLAAVMAVSWGVIGGASQGAGGQVGPQLASSASPASVAPGVAGPPVAVPVASTTPSPPSNELVVNTGQGPLIRDARLEELLAEHRQHGGMSALQMPTGFIRGATYDASGR